MATLLKSRKFWIMLLDVVISTATFFVTKYTDPDIAENIIWLIAAWQPVIIALIAGIAYEDGQAKSAGGGVG